MDPDAALANLRELIRTAMDVMECSAYGDCHESLGAIIEAFQALDMWLTSGGFAPAQWAVPRERQDHARR